MILTVLLWTVGQSAALLESVVDVVVPDAWLAILRSALHGFGTPLIQAALWHFNDATREAIAVSVDILFSLFVARMSIRAIRRIRSWLP